MFFVIDFETSALEPWDGKPLTLGIVPVTEDREILESQSVYFEFPLYTQPNWDNPDTLTSTEKFWLDQRETNREAWEAAWLRDQNDPLLTISSVMLDVAKYFLAFDEPRFIAANPVAFDKKWLDYCFYKAGIVAPYHYRCLCLRSMRYGVEYPINHEYGSAKGVQEPKIEHHALYDAIAEAHDLVHIMELSCYRHFDV